MPQLISDVNFIAGLAASTLFPVNMKKAPISRSPYSPGQANKNKHSSNKILEFMLL
jgi:hypothetical protein